jgi:hypothetical protein
MSGRSMQIAQGMTQPRANAQVLPVLLTESERGLGIFARKPLNGKCRGVQE